VNQAELSLGRLAGELDTLLAVFNVVTVNSNVPSRKATPAGAVAPAFEVA
jgi:hypothetical protein